ncbi:MAG: molecular chaperone [Spirochaetales bacterium]
MKRLALISILVLIASHVWGLNLEPLSREFSPDGRGRQQTFQVENTQGEDIAVRLRMFSRRLETDGSEQRRAIDGEFTVFPQQVVLAPGQRQTIRVQWNGEQEVDRERAYRLLVEQVPVEDRRGDGEEQRQGLSLSFMYRYVASVYVTPPEAEADVSLHEYSLGAPGGQSSHGVDAEFPDVIVSSAEDGTIGVRPLTMEFRNTGTRHMIVDRASVTVDYEREDGTADSLVLDNEELNVLFRRNILAGASVRQTVTLPADVVEQSLQITYEVRE